MLEVFGGASAPAGSVRLLFEPRNPIFQLEFIRRRISQLFSPLQLISKGKWIVFLYFFIHKRIFNFRVQPVEAHIFIQRDLASYGAEDAVIVPAVSVAGRRNFQHSEILHERRIGASQNKKSLSGGGNKKNRPKFFSQPSHDSGDTYN